MAVERVDIDTAGPPWKEEHAARYVFAAPRVTNLHVLDIACGTGFGSEILLDHGVGSVVAGDVSEEALEATRRRLARFGDRARVRREDGTALSFRDAVFDAVVSFETIEHIRDDEAFVAELSRVLKPGGRLFLSTPNALVTNPDGGTPENRFHVREYSPTELSTLLEHHLRAEEGLGQHMPAAYGVAPFLPSFDRRNLTTRQRINFFYWRFLLRLGAVRDPIHRAVTGFGFYPSAKEYTFLPDDLQRAHVQLWVCAKP